MEAVHILLRRDGKEHPLLADMGGQGELYQDSVYILTLVQFPDDAQQLFLPGLLRQFVGKGADAHILAGLLLVPHVHGRGRIRAHLNHRQGALYALFPHPRSFFP